MDFEKALLRHKLKLDAKDIKNPMIGFCTCCGNRFKFLKQTIKPNLVELCKYSNVSWTIVDYASETPVYDNIMNLVGERYLESKKVRVFRYETDKGFNMSHSKNLSHRLSDSMFLFNLDCDVILKEGCINYLFSCIQNNHFFGHCRKQGLYGAILLLGAPFYKIKGYDERFVRWASEDRKMWHDLNKIEPYTLYNREIFDPKYFRHIDHSNALRFSWGEKHYYNSKKEHTFGRGDVIDCFTGEKICVW